MTPKKREKSTEQQEKDSEIARKRIFEEDDVRVQVHSRPVANDPSNFEVPDDDPDAA